MAVRNWTEEQKRAIDTRDRTLLVSAAAGSGKTATLTERIINTVLDEEAKGDICKMLIVTFTNAAVNELRLKISDAIRECAMANPANARLEEQLLRVKDARIVTINSFCNDILRMTADEVGLPPNYRIAEPAEAGLIARNILEGMITAAFEGELSEDFTKEEFAEVVLGLVGVKNERELSDVFTLIYDKVSSEIEGVATLRKLSLALLPKDGGVDGVGMIAYIKAKLREMLEAELEMMSAAYRMLDSEGAAPKTLEVFTSDIDNIRLLLSCESYSEIHGALSQISDLTMVKSKVGSYDRAKKIRDGYVANRRKFFDKYFAISEEDLLYLLNKVYKSTNIIYKFLDRYDAVFLEEKKRRGIVEFRDAERYALLALVNKDGGVTPLAKELSGKYSDIYIDEYQDVNALQAGVFEAISRADNCFMVGDIKQSIYGFRSAKPEHFADKKKNYPPLGGEGDYPCASLFMSRNFRCDKPIIDFTNGIFDKLFDFFSENIGYTSADRLTFAKVYGDGEVPTMHTPEIRLIEGVASRGTEELADSDTPEADAMLYEEISNMRLSADEVAELVDSLVGKARLASGRLVVPSDIAILTRSSVGIEAEYTSALKAKGYECDIADSKSFFLNEEVLLAISLLNSIDNPRRDVYLTALMTSPLFDFSFDELLGIKKLGNKDTLYSSLVAYSELCPDDKKAKEMIDTLAKYRKIAEGMSVDTFITKLYKETGLLTLASANGGRDNLMLLYSHARRYEKTSFKGLHSFIAYLNSVIENDGEFVSGENTGSPDGKITILTYHRSKGLEFPIVIMVETQKRLSVTDRGASARIKLAPDFGFSVGVREPEGLAMLRNPLSEIIALYKREREFEEALRVLYVALTRARERLYIFGTAKDTDKLIEQTSEAKEFLSKYTVSEMSNLLEIILSCRDMGTIVCKSPELKKNIGDTNEPNEYQNLSEANEAENAKMPSGEPCAGEAEILARFKYEYPLKVAPHAPEKLSVSLLSPSVLDIEDNGAMLADIVETVPSGSAASAASPEDGVRQGNPDGESLYSDTQPDTLPVFMSGTNPRLSAERGVATHTFMQFCDFERLAALSSKGELEMLIEDEFISAEDAELVRCDEIDAFVKSELFSEIRSAKWLYREQRFNLKLPADRFTTDEAAKRELSGFRIMAQGVIDCVIEREDGTLHLIDYKTDRLSPAERRSPELARKKLTEAHGLQLYYYSQAVESIFGKAPDTVGIYSMHLGAEVTVDLDAFAEANSIRIKNQ